MDRQRNEYTRFAWAGGTFFLVVEIGLFIVVAGNFHYDRKKKIQSSVWRVRDDYYDQKKRYSRLSLVAIVIFVLVQLELNLIRIH